MLVSLRLKETPDEPRPLTDGNLLIFALKEIWNYVKLAGAAFFGTRAAFVGLLFALLPAGAYALGLQLQTNLAVELNLSKTQIGWLTMWSTIISAAGCVVGGLLSDRFGRRRMLALYLACTSIPTAYLAVQMYDFGWIMPIDPNATDRPAVPGGLVTCFWAAVMVHSLFQGLMYGTRTALFMDITSPAVAATQFTAYMALLNLVISYSAWWQGWVIQTWGYPTALGIDSVVGLIGILLLPWMVKTSKSTSGE